MPLAEPLPRTRPPAASNPEVYLVWSNEHQAWWGMRGYSQRLSRAKYYSREGAIKVCAEAMPGTAARLGMMPEVPVRLIDAQAVAAAYRQQYPRTLQEDWE